MKAYVKPDIKVINLRVEERISGSPCIVLGSCEGANGQIIVTNNVGYWLTEMGLFHNRVNR